MPSRGRCGYRVKVSGIRTGFSLQLTSPLAWDTLQDVGSAISRRVDFATTIVSQVAHEQASDVECQGLCRSADRNLKSLQRGRHPLRRYKMMPAIRGRNPG